MMKKGKMRTFLYYGLLPLALFYEELVLLLSTDGLAGVTSVFYMLLFSVSLGGVFLLLSTLTKSIKLNRVIRLIFLVAFAFLFSIIYLCYTEYGIFYDWKTMTAGAGGITEYVDEINMMVFCPAGITHMLLCYLPVFFYIVWGMILKNDEAIPAGAKRRIHIVEGMVASLVVVWIILGNNKQDFAFYTTEYTFAESMPRFGLMQSLEKDIFLSLTEKNSGGMSFSGIYTGENSYYSDAYEDIAVEDTFANEEMNENPVTSLETVLDETVNVDEAEKQNSQVHSSDALAEEEASLSKEEPDEGTESVSAEENNEDIEESEKEEETETQEEANASDGAALGQISIPAGVQIPVKPVSSEYALNKLNIDFIGLAQGANNNLASLDYYVASQVPSLKNAYTGKFKGKNLIFITAEAFALEAISETYTPTLYRMAMKGMQFTDYYQPAGAGTTGGEFQNVFGMLCVDGGASFKETATHLNYMTMGTQLTRLGYSGCTFHNGSVTYYDRHLTHVNIGYPDGYLANGNGYENLAERGKASYDTELFTKTLPLYMNRQPFNLYYMSVSGHSPYSPTSNKFAGAHYKELAPLPYSDMVKGYLSTQMEFDKAMEQTIAMLEAAGIADDTVIVISADHFPYGLQTDTTGNTYLEELYGQRITNNFILNHNRLIIWSGCLEKEEPILIDSPVCSIDILPTLLNLFGVDYDSRLLPGRDVFSDQEAIVYFTNYNWKTEIGTYMGKFIPNEGVVVPEGYVDRIKTIVKDKITFTKGVLWYDYYRHVFGAQVAAEEALAAQNAQNVTAEEPVE